MLRDGLGQAIEFERDGWHVRVDLPKERTDWFLDKDKTNYPSGPFASASTASEVVPIIAVRVSVSREAPFGANDMDSQSAQDGLTAYDTDALAFAESVVSDLVGWARIQKGQAWLGMSHARPVPVGPRFTFDEDADEQIVYGTGQVVFEDREPKIAISTDDFKRFAPLLGDGRPDMPLGDVLIADGRHLLTLEKPNPSQAVLLAAIGSEVKVKAALRAKADAAQRPFVELILSKPREVTVQAISLFDQVMTLVNGRSLKSDNNALFVSLGRLFELRNAVAHKGELVTAAQAGPAVSAAVDAASWLDGL